MGGRHDIPRKHKRPRPAGHLAPLVSGKFCQGSSVARDRHQRRVEHFLSVNELIAHWCELHEVKFQYVKGSCAWKFNKARGFANLKLARGYFSYCSDYMNWRNTAWHAKCNDYLAVLAHLEQWVRDIPLE